MISLARGQANNSSLLNWFTTLSGVAVDAYEMGFRILDQTEGSPGTQVFPATAGAYENVTSGPGHFGTGSYYAYNAAMSDGWSPPSGSNLGQYKIEWRWKGSSASDYQIGSELFLVVEEFISAEPLYIPISKVRAAGIPTPPSDADVEESIRLWQSFIERATRQWYYPKNVELYVDGTDSDALHFGVPIIGIDELRINNDPNPLDVGSYRVYNSSDLSDRSNPRIKLISANEQDRSIYTAGDRFGRMLFRKGRQNQYIKGTFGYVEPDGSVPRLIQRAVLLLVIEKLANPPYVAEGTDPIAPPPIIAGALLEEWTDGHRLRYGLAGGDVKPRVAGLLGITNNPEVLRIISLFKAPLGMATPANPTYR